MLRAGRWALGACQSPGYASDMVKNRILLFGSRVTILRLVSLDESRIIYIFPDPTRQRVHLNYTRHKRCSGKTSRDTMEKPRSRQTIQKCIQHTTEREDGDGDKGWNRPSFSFAVFLFFGKAYETNNSGREHQYTVEDGVSGSQDRYDVVNDRSDGKTYNMVDHSFRLLRESAWAACIGRPSAPVGREFAASV